MRLIRSILIFSWSLSEVNEPSASPSRSSYVSRILIRIGEYVQETRTHASSMHNAMIATVPPKSPSSSI